MKIVSLKDLPVLATSHGGIGRKKNMIGQGEIPQLLQFSHVSFASGEVAAEHTHEDMYEVFFVEDGHGLIRVDGKSYSIEKGMCITVAPKELHEITCTGPEDLVLTYFGLVAYGFNIELFKLFS